MNADGTGAFTDPATVVLGGIVLHSQESMLAATPNRAYDPALPPPGQNGQLVANVRSGRKCRSCLHDPLEGTKLWQPNPDPAPVPMAIPSFGGMVIEVITMLIVPVLYCAEFKLKTGIRDALLASGS